jgi:hypothetical protein
MQPNYAVIATHAVITSDNPDQGAVHAMICCKHEAGLQGCPVGR